MSFYCFGPIVPPSSAGFQFSFHLCDDRCVVRCAVDTQVHPCVSEYPILCGKNMVDLDWSSFIPHVSRMHDSSLNSTSGPCHSLTCALPFRPNTAVPTKSLSQTPAQPTFQSMPSSIPSLGLFRKIPCFSKKVSWMSLILHPLCGRCTDRVVIFVHHDTASHLVPRDRNVD